MQNSILVVNKETIKDKIYKIRGQKVMIDSDLAELYGYTTKAFNQQVKNNINKFDPDFMFQLTTEEVKELSRSKKLTLNNGRGHNIKYNPYVFTESGIYMLMTVLKGELATKQSKALIRIFKEMKDYIIDINKTIKYEDFLKLSLQTNENTINNLKIQKDIEKIKREMATKKDVIEIIENFTTISYDKEKLILNGEYIESNLAYNDIYHLATKKIYIIDDYINLKTLVLLKNINKNIKVIIFSDNVNNGLHKIEYQDFIKEYNLNILFKKTNKQIHDRYIIIDYKFKNEHIFHAGASSKDSGNKVTTLTEINDKTLFKELINKLLKNQELNLK